MGYFLLNPLRRIMQNPDALASAYLKAGQKVLEIGPGMGYFTIPMAKQVGKEGKITAVDIQERMLKALRKRAQKAGVLDRIELLLASPDSFGLEEALRETYDFAFAFAVVHELPDLPAFFREIYAALKPKGMLLMADPESRFSEDEYENALKIAKEAGLRKLGEPALWKSRAALLQKIE
jgi:ubiquinone/menaquinone biosynthesis C-methylase UbiE